MVRIRSAAVAVLSLAVFASGQSTQQKKPRTGDQIVAQEVVITGTSTLTTEQLQDISNTLTSVTMHDSDDEVEARIAYQFQQLGYFDVEVTNLKVVALDPLAKKKPVRIEAEVNEGPLFHLQELKFSGNRTFTVEELRSMFPIHDGDVFNAEKIRLGLEAMNNQYLAKGFLESTPVPDTQKSGAGLMTVTFAIDEGTQYRMGELKIHGPGEPAEKLTASWALKPGEPYDYAYLEKYLGHNREYLPQEFEEDRDVIWLRDCSDNTINVTIELDPKRPWKPKSQDKPCEPQPQIDKDRNAKSSG